MKFCKSCFEASVQCQHGLESLSSDDKAKVLNEVKKLRAKQSFENDLDFSSESVDVTAEQRDYQKMFADHMQDSLIRSQCSIIVTSAEAKVIVINKEDKSFLNESLKQAIDKAIMDKNFMDFDRPLVNFKAVREAESQNRGWIQYKRKA